MLISFDAIAQNGPDLFISEYLEGLGNNQAIEVFNPTANPADLNNYLLVRSEDGGGWKFWRPFPSGISLPSGSVWTIVNNQFTSPVFDISIADETDLSPFITFRGNDAIGLLKVSAVDTILLDIIGIPDYNPGSGWDVAGILNATANHTLIRKPDIITGNTNWVVSAGDNPANSEWIAKVYDFADSLGHHYFKPVILINSLKLSGSGTIDVDHGIIQLIADILPVNVSDLMLLWSTSDPLVASVNQNGLVQAFNNGSVWVRALAADGSGISDSMQITILNQSGLVPVNSIMPYGKDGMDTIYLNQGKLIMIADIQPVNATNKLIKWSVNDTLLASITSDGIITAKKNGKVIVTATAVDGSGISGSATIEIISQYTEISTLSSLRASYSADETVYKITVEVVVSHSIFNRNIKYVQDGSGGIQIDDESGIISNTFNSGDGITGLKGYLQESYGMLLFHPMEDPGLASSQNNTLTPILLTIKEFNDNFELYESRLIKINRLRFDQAGELFMNYTNYQVRAGNEISILRTEFANADFLGSEIPDSANITGIAIQFNNTPKISPRKLSDFENLSLSGNSVQKYNFNNVCIYPNPVNRELHVLSETDIDYFEIRDVTGRIIQNRQTLNNGKIIDTENLNEGLYIITFYIKNNKMDYKFIKN